MKKRNVLMFLTETVIVMLVVMPVTICSDENPSTNILPNNLNVRDIKIDPHNTNVLYAGIDKRGLYRSTDKGETWVQCGSGFPPGEITTIAFDPVKRIIYVGTSKSLHMSYDGDKWIYLADFNLVYHIFIQPAEPSTIYVCTSRGLYVGTDVRTLKKIDTLVPTVSLHPLDIDPSNHNIIYFAMNKPNDVVIHGWNELGMYKSNDHGETLKKISTITLEILLISPNNKNVMYGTIGKKILKSIDGGASWKEKDISILEPSITGLVMNPIDTNIFYATTSYLRGQTGLDYSISRIFKSVDSGETWQKISEFPVNKIVIDPSNPDILYAGTPKMGIYKSTDAGKTWKAINNGIE